MSTNRFLGLVSGVTTWFTAINNSAGVADANKIISTGNDGKLDPSLMPAGIGAATEVMVASETLVAGDFVNIWLDTGVRKARKADNSNTGRNADGFVLNAVAANANATVTLQGVNTGLSGLTIGTRYFLGTAGGVATTSPTASGSFIQPLGKAVSATGLNFESDPITIIA
jgi:hypothetical protein